MQRAGATIDEKREVTRVVAALDRDRPDRLDHAGAGDLDDADRGFIRIDIQPGRQGLDAGARKIAADGHPPAKQRLAVQPSQIHVRIGHGGIGTAQIVAGRTRYGTGAPRADLHQASAIDPGD